MHCITAEAAEPPGAPPCTTPPYTRKNPIINPTHRPLSSSFFMAHIYLESYKVLPKTNYVGVYG